MKKKRKKERERVAWYKEKGFREKEKKKIIEI